MSHTLKSMEFLAFGALSAWGTYRVIGWLRQPPAKAFRRPPAMVAALRLTGFPATTRRLRQGDR